MHNYADCRTPCAVTGADTLHDHPLGPAEPRIFHFLWWPNVFKWLIHSFLFWECLRICQRLSGARKKRQYIMHLSAFRRAAAQDDETGPMHGRTASRGIVVNNNSYALPNRVTGGLAYG